MRDEATLNDKALFDGVTQVRAVQHHVHIHTAGRNDVLGVASYSLGLPVCLSARASGAVAVSRCNGLCVVCLHTSVGVDGCGIRCAARSTSHLETMACVFVNFSRYYGMPHVQGDLGKTHDK